MATNTSVWSAMNYIPPRGPCNFKSSIIGGSCNCKRFMLHPIKAATSFECDGCSHHASFHTLENPAEERVLEMWRETASAEVESKRVGKKRKLMIEAGPPVVAKQLPSAKTSTLSRNAAVGHDGSQ